MSFKGFCWRKNNFSLLQTIKPLFLWKNSWELPSVLTYITPHVTATFRFPNFCMGLCFLVDDKIAPEHSLRSKFLIFSNVVSASWRSETMHDILPQNVTESKMEGRKTQTVNPRIVQLLMFVTKQAWFRIFSNHLTQASSTAVMWPHYSRSVV